MSESYRSAPKGTTETRRWGAVVDREIDVGPVSIRITTVDGTSVDLTVTHPGPPNPDAWPARAGDILLYEPWRAAGPPSVDWPSTWRVAETLVNGWFRDDRITASLDGGLTFIPMARVSNITMKRGTPKPVRWREAALEAGR